MSSAVAGKWLDHFFDSYYRHRPVNATFIGEHKYDHRLPDYSQAGVDAALADAESLLRQVQSLDVDGCSEVERMDLRLAEGFLRIQQWEFASQHFQAGNPSLYTGEASFGIISLLLTDFAPAAERAQAAVERMHAVGALLDQAQMNVPDAPRSWSERALRECAGARALLGRGIEMAASETGVDVGPLRKAADEALNAFARYEAFLRTSVASSAGADVACGGEVLDGLLRDGHMLSMSGDDIVRYAEEQLALTKERLAEQAAAFQAADWQEAMARLADIHPTVDGYLSRYQTLWDESRALVEARDLLTWPEFPIAYVPQPHWAREAAPFLYFLFYRAPAAFNRPSVHHYLVTPIDETLSEVEQQRRLRATNDSVIKLNHVVHHGGVGHHVQNWNAYHGPSRIGRVAAVDCASRIAMFCGGTMAEGWACYATTLMGEAGFLTPLETFSELQTDLRMAARSIVDVRLHQGRMSLDDAASFYAEQTGMSSEASMGEAVKNSMFPGAAVIYLMGRDQILQAREQMRSELGAGFDMRTFHDQLLSYGSVPVSMAVAAVRTVLTSEPVTGATAHAE